MFEKFTVSARRVVVLAQEDARERKQDHIRSENLLISLYAAPPGATAPALLGAAGLAQADVESEVERIIRDERSPDAAKLKALGIDLEEVRRAAEENFGPGALERTRAGKQRRLMGHIPFDAASKKALELALREALALKHKHIGSEHVLLGLLAADGGAAHHIMTARGLTLESMRAAVAEAVAGEEGA
ncbi:Clp protease N-terminal domain-containing protein [Pseudonocardia ailaonensis]|uniref:Clp protease N-terminal domain-containing protein n=1 Tax=Pseudonocardia ailaonensis TaxID=367279 RepID=A0ABN2NMC0_9PSEU